MTDGVRGSLDVLSLSACRVAADAASPVAPSCPPRREPGYAADRQRRTRVWGGRYWRPKLASAGRDDSRESTTNTPPTRQLWRKAAEFGAIPSSVKPKLRHLRVSTLRLLHHERRPMDRKPGRPSNLSISESQTPEDAARCSMHECCYSISHTRRHGTKIPFYLR